jgi:hypothetical protein
MSVDYYASLAVGFEVTGEELNEIFGAGLPEISHMEPRFDPKTGRKTKPEKVITQHESRILRLDGEDYEDEHALVEAIASSLSCSYHEVGSHYDDQENMSFIFCPDIKAEFDGFDDSRLTCSGGISYKTMLNLKPELERISKGLKKMGIDPGEAMVTVAGVVS